MKKGTKIFLIILVVLLVLCVCSCVAASMFFTNNGGQFMQSMLVDDEQVAAEVGDAISEYTVPPGYSENMAINMGVMKMVMIMPDNNMGQMIALVQIPGIIPIDSASLQEQVQMQLQQQYGAPTMMERFNTDTMTINGQEVELVYYKGYSTEYQTSMRMLMSDFFQVDSGQVMVMSMGADGLWNQTMVDNFLQSIR